jgi:hypothetical protein
VILVLVVGTVRLIGSNVDNIFSATAGRSNSKAQVAQGFRTRKALNSDNLHDDFYLVYRAVSLPLVEGSGCGGACEEINTKMIA